MTQAKEKKIINFPAGPEGHLALLPWISLQVAGTNRKART